MDDCSVCQLWFFDKGRAGLDHWVGECVYATVFPFSGLKIIGAIDLGTTRELSRRDRSLSKISVDI